MGRFKTHEERASKKMRKIKEAQDELRRRALAVKEMKEPDSPALSKFAGIIHGVVFGEKK